MDEKSVDTGRFADDYFAKKYQLSLPHSELCAALPHLSAGRALDIGCGRGRNTLYLNSHGFDVTGWDSNTASLAQLQQIIDQEQLTGIDCLPVDLNQHRFNGSYQLVMSTVVMMFLQPKTIPRLIADMQAATAKEGFNLIVSAMDTADTPCPLDFPFTFKSGELSHYYRNWHILKYNEHHGELHKRDESGQRIRMRFATLLAQKTSIK
ncbi:MULTISPECIES: tellurite resistance methyltransferase TehB [Tatumella]|uniref:Tellurite resistance protein n=2 Tax=Tatumella ptyseos TaxID=82987 RepID=A0A085JHU3_9GAMM|nr:MULTISPECIES: tellurite resistance methyltransferase TehB [Tatumella]KFD20039.1 tellurite resistance protein [Tatumella ptyseos ATCC 33301]SQK75882.1 Tellurite resistance protein TehB [Tatumella ptyseos]